MHVLRPVLGHRPAARLLSGAILATIVLAGCSSQSDSEGSGAAEPATRPASTSSDADPSTAAPPATGPGRASAPMPADAPAEAVLALGAEVYGQQCAMCHGQGGRGDGAMASMLKVEPRSFIGEPWKYLDGTSRGTEHESMIALLRAGLPEAQMPEYDALLSDEQLDAVAHYVLALRDAG